MYCRCERDDCRFCNPVLPPQSKESTGRRTSSARALRQLGNPGSEVYDRCMRLARCGARVQLGLLRAGQIEYMEATIKALQAHQGEACLITDKHRAIPLDQLIFLNDALLENPFSQKGTTLRQLVEQATDVFGGVMPVALTLENTYRLDLTPANADLRGVNTADPVAFGTFLRQKIQAHGAVAAVGGYAERRLIYQRSAELYGAGEAARCIHLGIDIWMPAGTAIRCPLDGVVHSVADNAGLGDYGPTVILEHAVESVTFYTLYGHLSRVSLHGLTEGQTRHKDEVFATLGSHEENGGWPSHLHYQMIADLLGCRGDFPGVSTRRAQQFYLGLCPPPPLLAL